ncbi:hypothetical protein Tco_1193110 [Tanacetum coccineum]
MDAMTANMCHNGKGRLGYARVLVEVDALKELLETIEVVYRGGIVVQDSKFVKVVYDLKPARCQHCNAFGHDCVVCKVKPGIDREEVRLASDVGTSMEKDENHDDDRFVKVSYGKKKKNVETQIPMASDRNFRLKGKDKKMQEYNQPLLSHVDGLKQNIRYFKDNWELQYEVNKKNGGLVEIEDVLEDESESAQFLTIKEIEG